MRIKRILEPNAQTATQPSAALAALTLLLVLGGAAVATASTQRALPANITPAIIKPFAATRQPYVAAVPVQTPPLMIAPAAIPVAPMLTNALPAAEQEKKPIRVSGGVMAGNVLTKVPPAYPADAKAAKIQGSVVLNAIISSTGDVTNLQVASGPEALTKSAIDAVQQWKYKPYLLNGQPQEVETTITVNYTLAP